MTPLNNLTPEEHAAKQRRYKESYNRRRHNVYKNNAGDVSPEEKLNSILKLRAKRDARISAARRAIRKVLKAQAERRALFSRQVTYDDAFVEYYLGAGDSAKILKPPYLPEKMYEIAEESGVLSACIETFVRNVGGYGWLIVPIRDAEGVELTIDAQEKQRLLNLLSDPNGFESFNSIRRKLRRDYDTTGNAYLEVIRDKKGHPLVLLWADAKKMRLTPVDDTPTELTLKLPRGDSPTETVSVPIQKQFRRFVQLQSSANGANTTLRYFKEFGDPRAVNALSGRAYPTTPTAADLEAAGEKEFLPATEIIHFKYGNGTYGIPRWIGLVLTALGVSRADFVNFDLFDNQGIPPMVITMAGGRLTDQSWLDIQEAFKGAKSLANFNKLLLLEVESLSDHIDQTGREPIPRVELKNLAEFRKEDAMFTKYLEQGTRFIREFGFRLPSLFVGDSGSFNYATARTAREVTEEQIFAPEREQDDDIFNSTIVKALEIKTCKIKSAPPVYTNTEDLVGNLGTLAQTGALTINELIGIVNRFFGTNIQPYTDADEEWANVPICFLLKPGIDQTGKLKPEIIGYQGNTAELAKNARTATPEEAESDDVSDEDTSSRRR